MHRHKCSPIQTWLWTWKKIFQWSYHRYSCCWLCLYHWRKDIWFIICLSFLLGTLTFTWVNFFFFGFVAGLPSTYFLISSVVVHLNVYMLLCLTHWSLPFLLHLSPFCRQFILHMPKISMTMLNVMPWTPYSAKADRSNCTSCFPAKIPFPLTQRFRAMLQNVYTTVDVSYISSRSWYFLNLFELKGLLALYLEKIMLLMMHNGWCKWVDFGSTHQGMVLKKFCNFFDACNACAKGEFNMFGIFQNSFLIVQVCF